MGGKRRRENKQKKKKEKQEVEEQESEDYCFVCKDGGLLIVCDQKECVKAYHLECVGKKESSEDEEDEWICGWHTCLVCKKSSRYQCFCCPNAVCQRCYKDAAFARIRGNKGFCHDCLKLALLGEEGMDVDSDGEKVDFRDRETYEGLFKEYWDIIKEKEGLTLEDLHNADVKIKKGEEYVPRSHKSNPDSLSKNKSNSDSDEYVNKEEEEEEEHEQEEKDKGSSDDDVGIHDIVQPIVDKNKKMPKRARARRKGSRRIEFVGWASRSLMEFLESIGVDASKKRSQDDVASLINKFAQEHKLFNPEKKKVVLCDVRLRSLLGRKSFNMYKINDALEPHFAENIDQSEDEGYSSGCDEGNASLSTKKEPWWRKVGSFQHKGSLMEKFQQKEPTSEEPFKKDTVVKVVYSRYATIGPKNMKLVYLRKSLVEQLLQQDETFESKVVGSFVKVKSDPLDSKHQYQLLPVTGVKKDFSNGNNKQILLQVSILPNDVPISSLSNDDLSEEDCENLRQKVENGLVEKPTVAELEEKAKSLHEDITKHWIARELSTLKHRIDLANEKGRRAELYEYRKRRDLLQSKEEQARMLSEVPKVIADVIDRNPEDAEPDANSGKVITVEESEQNKVADSRK